MDVFDFDEREYARRFGFPNYVTISPPCTAFSVARIGYNWTKDIDENGERIPKTEAAREGLMILRRALEILDYWAPEYFILENPRGMMRKMIDLEPIHRATVWYCRYADFRAKPTDLWMSDELAEIWEPLPMCKNGATKLGLCHHQPSPRGADTGTQSLKKIDRSIIPIRLTPSVATAVIQGLCDSAPRCIECLGCDLPHGSLGDYCSEECENQGPYEWR